MEEELQVEEWLWDKPHYYWKGELFTPKVCLDEESLNSFNTITIKLDGRLKSDLNWHPAREMALKAVEKGLFVLWEIDLGLFSELPFPLINQTQFLSLGISLEHFRDTLWKEFRDRTLGIIVYRGHADFSIGFPWNEVQESNWIEWRQEHFNGTNLAYAQSLFCRDVIVEYLQLLTSRLPDALPCYILLDAQSVNTDSLWQALLLNPERFEQLNVAVKGATIPLPYATWSDETIIFSSSSPTSIGICLPSMELFHPRYYEGLQGALKSLLNKKIPFRLIPENHLITSWDGLDDLLYVPTGLSHEGKRKLQGFCAAGGTVVTLGKKLGLPYEIELTDLLNRI